MTLSAQHWTFLMRIKPRFVVLALLLALVVPRPMLGQTYSCAPIAGTDALNLRDYVVRLTGGDPSLTSTRLEYQLPLTSPSQVKTVGQSNTCSEAAQAYHLATRGPSVPAISRSVVVIKVGNSRYVVMDPVELAGEFQVTVIFNSNFQALVSFDS